MGLRNIYDLFMVCAAEKQEYEKYYKNNAKR